MDLADVKSDQSLFAEIGMKVGNDHTYCPAHGGKDSVSCKVLEGGTIVWKCHSCGAAGSIIEAYSMHHEIDKNEAIKRLVGSPAAKMVAPDYDLRFPGEIKGFDTFPTDDGVGWKYSDASMIDVATAKIGEKIIASCTVRWDFPGQDPSKQMRQFHYDGRRWNFGKLKGSVTPIYKMKDIADDKSAGIIVVEGEKCMRVTQNACNSAYEADSNFGKWVVTTWGMGAGNIAMVNWNPLKGRRVIFIRDNDEPGLAAAKNFKGIVRQAKIINLGGKEGEDIADFLMRGDSIVNILSTPQETFTGEKPLQSNVSLVGQVVDVPNISYDDALSQVKELRGPDAIEDFIGTCVEAGFSKIKMDMIYTEIRKHHKISARALKEAGEKTEKIDWSNETATAYLNNTPGLIYNSLMFWQYTGTHWEIKSNDVISKDIDATAERTITASGVNRAKTLREASELVRARSSTDDDYLRLREEPYPIINTLSGELHIGAKGKISLKPHSKENKLTHCLNVAYDPKAKCPKYDAAILDIFSGNEAMVRHFEEIAGYLIQPIRDIKIWTMFYGGIGNNGKSSVKDLIIALMGSQNILQVKMHKWGNGNHDQAQLVGKMLMVDDDMEKGTKLPDGLLKELSERKPLTANKKFKDDFQFVSYAAVLMCTNHWPYTNDLTKAMRSRAQIFVFNQEFTDNPKGKEKQIDRSLFKYIKDNELSGVLNRFLAGLKSVRERGGFKEPREVYEARGEWLKEISNLVAFADMCVERTNDEKDCIFANDLRLSYENWCHQAGVGDDKRVQQKALKRALQDLEYNIDGADNNKGGWKVVGANLLDIK